MDEVASGLTTREIEALEQAIEEAKVANSASWFDLWAIGIPSRMAIDKSTAPQLSTNIFPSVSGQSRLGIAPVWLIQIAAWLFILQQITGNQFVVSYGATWVHSRHDLFTPDSVPTGFTSNLVSVPNLSPILY